MKNKAYAVGGFVRDVHLNKFSNSDTSLLKPKDVDIAIQVSNYEELISACYSIDPFCIIKWRDTVALKEREKKMGRLLVGFHPSTLPWINEQYKLIFGKVPQLLYCDVLACRSEGDYRDGRHPEWVRYSSIEEDLQRRDFTVNALAINLFTGETLDLFGGIEDIGRKQLKTVRLPYITFTEHIIRILRGLRLAIEKDFTLDSTIINSFNLDVFEYSYLLKKSIFTDSIREELHKMFKYDTVTSIKLINNNLPLLMKNAIFDKIHLVPSSKK